MTLHLELISSSNFASQNTLLVTGSEAGQLYQSKISNKDFVAKCNRHNILKLEVYSNKELGHKLASTDFSVKRFLRQNKTNPQLYGSQPIKYTLNLFSNQDRLVGTLTFSIKYIPGLLYKGQKWGNLETIPQKEPVKIYAGVSETKNIFNFFDSGSENKRFNFCEGTYRDETWGELEQS